MCRLRSSAISRYMQALALHMYAQTAAKQLRLFRNVCRLACGRGGPPCGWSWNNGSSSSSKAAATRAACQSFTTRATAGQG